MEPTRPSLFSFSDITNSGVKSDDERKEQDSDHAMETVTKPAETPSTTGVSFGPAPNPFDLDQIPSLDEEAMPPSAAPLEPSRVRVLSSSEMDSLASQVQAGMMLSSSSPSTRTHRLILPSRFQGKLSDEQVKTLVGTLFSRARSSKASSSAYRPSTRAQEGRGGKGKRLARRKYERSHRPGFMSPLPPTFFRK